MVHDPFFPEFRSPLLRLGLVLALSLCVSGVSLAEDTLTSLEESLFSHSYTGESDAQRLERIEKSVFGEAQTGTEADRKARLNEVFIKVRKRLPTNQAAKNTTDDSSPANPGDFQNSYASPAPAREPDATDYPTVTALERQVFGRDFIRDDVTARLTRLEKKVFGQPYPQNAMADRVDKLLARYANLSPNAGSAPQVVDVSPALQNLPDDPSQFAGSGRDIYSKVDALERHRFNGKSHPNGLLTERLDRLEQRAYGQNFSGESVDARINRLMGQHQTNASGTMGRPGFQARQPYQHPGDLPQVITPTVTSRTTGPQNIQIGGGFSSNSTHQLSPEMMSMLPPNVRAQMSGTGGNTGTMVRSPGTVVIERQTFGSPGFQTYGNAPIQHYNYYGAPGTQVQSQTTTTVIQPDGNQAVYGYPGANPNSGNANGLPTPAYVGNPAFLQSLNQLEINVFKQVNTVEPVPIRLGRLETAILGQMYVGTPDQQRLENLEKAYRMQAVSKLLGQSKGANMGRGVGSIFLGVPLNSPNPINPMGMPQPLPINPGVFGR